MALPAVLHGEWMALPFNVFAGIVAGQLRRFAPEQDDIWSFSPFVDQSIYRLIRRNLLRPRVFDWQITFFLTILGLRLRANPTGRVSGLHAIFSTESPDNWWVYSVIYAAAVAAIGIELKIFNSVRIQIKLEEQERLLHARAHGGAAEPDQSAFPV